jgi:hypothetical protein
MELIVVLKNLRAAWAEISLHKEGHLKWWQKLVVLCAVLLEVAVLLTVVVLFLKRDYSVAIFVIWVWFSATGTLYINFAGDAHILRGQSGKTLPWPSIALRLLIVAVYSTFNFENIVRRAFVERNDAIEQPKDYDF